MEILVEALSAGYKDKTVINDISFQLKNGICALLGCNGAGKSTLIKVLVGIKKPEMGRVIFDGKDTVLFGKEYRRNLGYLPQDCDYYGSYSAWGFMRYMAKLKGTPRELITDRCEKYLKMVALWDVRNKKINSFSGGMKHRLGIAQALVNEPELLILDEPTTGLDYIERKNFKDFISKYAEEHIVLISTHIISDVEDIAEQVFVLKDGIFALNEKKPFAMSVNEMYKSIMEK